MPPTISGARRGWRDRPPSGRRAVTPCRPFPGAEHRPRALALGLPCWPGRRRSPLPSASSPSTGCEPARPVAPARGGHGGPRPRGPHPLGPARPGRHLAAGDHDRGCPAPPPRHARRRRGPPLPPASGRRSARARPRRAAMGVGRAGGLGRLDPHHAGGAAAGAAATQPAEQGDRGAARIAARGALLQGRDPRHLAHPGADGRQPGGCPRRVARLVRPAGGAARPCRGGAAGRHPAPARGAAARPPPGGSPRRARRPAGPPRRRGAGDRARGPRRRRPCAAGPAADAAPRAAPGAGTGARGGGDADRRHARPAPAARGGGDRRRSVARPAGPRLARAGGGRAARAGGARPGRRRVRRRGAGRGARPDAGGALGRLGAEAGALRPGLRGRAGGAGDPAGRPAAALRRLCAGEHRPRLRRADHGGGRAAAVAEPAGGRAAVRSSAPSASPAL